MNAVAFLLVAILAAAYDLLAIRWHEARERRQVGRAVVLSVGMEVAGSLPIAAAVMLGDWRLLAAGIVGSVVGTAWGLRAAPDR